MNIQRGTAQRGFTLIELMIVVAIIAILAAIAISQYQDYVIRTQVGEAATLADGAKTAVADFLNNSGHFAASNESMGLATKTSISGRYVSELDAATGVIKVTFNSTSASTAIQGKSISFSPVTHAGSVEWHCNPGASLDKKYVPTVCRD